MCAILSREDCMSLLNSIDNDYRLISYKLEKYSESPAGFLGVHYRLVIDCVINNNVEQKFSFFVKTMPSVQIHFDYVNDIGVFKKEILLFQDLIPELQDVTDSLQHPWSPKCYVARDNLLIFEDLCVKNYYTSIGKGIFDIDHCIAAMKTLADFHASSLIWQDKKKIKINEKYQSSVIESVYIHEENHPRNLWLISASNALIYLCKKIGRKVDEEYFKNIIKDAVTDMGPSPQSHNVLCHGDLWVNNFMFRKDPNDNELRAILVDYQIARYAPCSLDLMCCIYLITRQSLRNQHMSQLINVYYEELIDVLSRNNFDVAQMSIERLTEECFNYKITGIVEACIFGITIWLPAKLSEEALSNPVKCHDLILGDRSELMERAFQDSFFRNQLTDLLNELLDCCPK